MDFETLEKIVGQEPKLADSLSRAAAEIGPIQRDTRSFNVDPVSTAAGLGALVILFPVVNGIVCKIGLPWLKTLANYSELWRQRVEQWINEQYEQTGFDPEKTRTASEAMLKELLATTDAETRSAWQRLIELLPKGKS
jgi:hypothetical protein